MTAVRSSFLPSRKTKAAESTEDTDLVGAIGLCAGRRWQNAIVLDRAAGRGWEGGGVTVCARFPRSDEISAAQRRFLAVFHQRLSQYPALPCVAAGEFVSAAVRSRPFAPSLAFAVAGAARLPLVPLSGLTFQRCRAKPASPFTSCYGLLFCAPFSGGYSASAHPVTQMHWEPAT